MVSDWDGQQSGVATANAGLDIVMPDRGFWGKNLTEAGKFKSCFLRSEYNLPLYPFPYDTKSEHELEN